MNKFRHAYIYSSYDILVNIFFNSKEKEYKKIITGSCL